MPFSGQLNISKALSNIAVKYRNAEDSYVCDKLAPDVVVKQETGRYWVFDRSNFRIPQTIRANKGRSMDASTYEMTSTTYQLNEHAIHDIVTDRDRGNADAPLSPDADTTEYLTDIILQRREKMVSDLLTSTNWTNYANLGTTTAFSYLTTTSDPIGVVQTASTVILSNAGVTPNVMAMSYDAFVSLKNHPNILERIKYAERGIVTEDILSSIFDIPKVLVGKAVYNTAQEGTSEVMGWLMGQANADGTSSAALVAYINPSPGIRRPSALYNLVIDGKYKVKKWRDEERGGDVIEVSTMFQPIVPDYRAGYLLQEPVIR